MIRKPACLCFAACLATLTGIVWPSHAYAGSKNAYHDIRIHDVVAGIPHSAFYAIDFAGVRGLAVGGGGAIHHSSDAGRSWSPESEPLTQMSLFDVAMTDRHDIVVGQMGTVLTRRLGQSWQATITGTEMRLLAVGMNASGLALTVGQFGTLLRSRDYGQTWENIAPDWASIITVDGGLEPHLYDVHVDTDGSVIIVGELGLVLKSGDAGDSWENLQHGDASLFALSVLEGGEVFAVGQAGTFLYSDDAARSWISIPTGTDSSLLGLDVSDTGEIIAVGLRVMLHSPDKGRSWRSIEADDITTAWYQDVSSSIVNQPIFAVGHSGKIIRVLGK